jgi:hypothetical protein
MRSLIVELNIDRDEWLKLYRGQSQLVRARSREGLSVQFPANILSNYISHQGVAGNFRITFTNEGKFHSVEKLN